MRHRIVGILGIGLTLAWLALLFFHPYFSIKVFEIQGRERIPESELKGLYEKERAERRWFLIPQTNYFVFNLQDLNRAIQSRYVLDSLTVEKIFPHTIRITLKERLTQVAFGNGEKIALLSSDGQVITSYKEGDAALLGYPRVVLRATSTPRISQGAQVVSRATVTAVVQLTKAMRELKIQIAHYEVGEGGEIAAITKAGFRVLFDAGKDLEPQLKSFTIIFTQRFNKKPNVSRIDVRFPGRVFYE